MRATVMQPFPLSRDGINIERLEEGAVEDIPDALFSGLNAAGFVAEAPLTPDQVRDHVRLSALPGDDVAPPVQHEDLIAKHVGRGVWWLFSGPERMRGPFDSKEAAEAAR